MLRSSRFVVNKLTSTARFCTTSNRPIKAAIVGAGPAGFYSAQYILKHLQNSQVDVIEKLPVPFGLVRFGVAPDHPEVKNVINTFTKTAENKNFRFFGNVTLGKDVTLSELRRSYDVVLLSYGADVDARFNIPGEDLRNVISARELVAWYNGLPGHDQLNPDLSGEKVVILGQGNVAVDVARILLAPIDELRKTDITEYALEALSRSRVKTVQLVGRRGPLQAAFTIKELREMIKLKSVDTLWRPLDFEGIPEQIDALPRPRKRITELMIKSMTENSAANDRKFQPIFFRSPQKIAGNDKVESVDFAVTKLVNDKAIATDQIETLEAQLVCRSIGYKSISVDSEINFNDKLGRIVNDNGRVLIKDTDEIDRGLYTAGWLATGPQGVILTTMNNSFAVAQKIVDDVKSGVLSIESRPDMDFKSLNCVTWQDWERINQKEVENGVTRNKPREKLVDVEDMLKIIE